MKQFLLSVAFVMAGAAVTAAQDVTIEKKVEERPGVVVPVPVPGPPVTVEKRRERVETTGRAPGCETKSVTKEEPGESKTVTKKTC